MKKALSLFLAAFMALSFATACGNKKNSDDNTNGSTEAVSTEAANNESADSAGSSGENAVLNVEGADEEVDMGKVEGKKLDDAAPEDASLEAKGDIANCEVTISDAKVIDYSDQISGEQMKVVVVSFKFKNNNSAQHSFDSLISVDATQAGSDLKPTLVVGVEGVNTNSAMVNVESNDTITVQKTYRLNDETSDVNITAYKYGESSGASVSKAFKLN